VTPIPMPASTRPIIIVCTLWAVALKIFKTKHQYPLDASNITVLSSMADDGPKKCSNCQWYGV
jgi:hypothetical protein